MLTSKNEGEGHYLFLGERSTVFLIGVLTKTGAKTI